MGFLRLQNGPLFQDFLVLGLPGCQGGSPNDSVVGMSVDMQKALRDFALIQISRQEQNKPPGLMQLTATRWTA